MPRVGRWLLVVCLVSIMLTGAGFAERRLMLAQTDERTQGAKAPAMPGAPCNSEYEVVGEEPLAESGRAEIALEAFALPQPGAAEKPLAIRVVVTAADGSHPDGSGYGVFSDGRFFVDKGCTVSVPPGSTKVELQSGPDYVPLTFTVEAKAGRKMRVKARLVRWFSPEERGWFSGDNHVHVQHDALPQKKSDYPYLAVIGRAAGLSFVTEAGSDQPARDLDKLSTDSFILICIPENGAGLFVGHFNTPGITEPFVADKEHPGETLKRPLPAQVLMRQVRAAGGVLIDTHALSPAYQLHWMGATEAFSDSVLGQCADAFDIGGYGDEARYATELLYFGILNLGNRVSVNSYTDSTLERRNSDTPGDGRVYCQAGNLTYPGVVDAIRKGRTFATNGGPVFPFFTIDGQYPGATLRADGKTHAARLEVHSLYPLRVAQIFRNGALARNFEVAGKGGEVVLTAEVPEGKQSWYAARVEDEQGHWALTSAIRFEPEKGPARGPASVVIFEIANFKRFPSPLSLNFSAHLILTVSPDDRLREVVLTKDGEVVKRFDPAQGDELPGGRIPVTEMQQDVEYEPGWIWYPSPKQAVHFQMDWPVKESGWYAVRAITAKGREVTSDAVHFDASAPNSSSLCSARLLGQDTSFELRGYGEAGPLSDVASGKGSGDFWYTTNWWWEAHAKYGATSYHTGAGGNKAAVKKFRSRP